MANIVTSFGTATVVTPAAFQLNFSASEAATWLAELARIVGSTQNQQNYPDTFAVYTTLNACANSTAPIGGGGTAPPTTTQVS